MMAGRLAAGRVPLRLNLLDALLLLLIAALLPMAYFVHGLVSQRWVPEINDVDPSRVRQGADRFLYINGRRFDRWSRVTFNGHMMDDVRFVSPQRLEVVLPAQLATGSYTVQVTDFRQRTAVLHHALEVLAPPPRLPARLELVCLLVGLSPQQMRQLFTVLESERYREADDGIYLQRLYRAGWLGSKESAKWALINVHVSGLLDYVTDPPQVRYQNRFVEPGEPIELELGPLRLQGWVASRPQVVRVLKGAAG